MGAGIIKEHECIEVRLLHAAIDGIIVTLMHVQTFKEIFLSEINHVPPI